MFPTPTLPCSRRPVCRPVSLSTVSRRAPVPIARPLFKGVNHWKSKESLNRGSLFQSQACEEGSNGQTSQSILGAVALITGSTVGAGMLALPQATAAGGFLPSVAVLFFSWLLLASEALLMAEVNFSMKEKQNSEKQDFKKLNSEKQNFKKLNSAKQNFEKQNSAESVISLRDMADGTLGPAGGSLVSGLYLFLSYTLLVAYISKGGELLELLSEQNLSSGLSSVGFTLSIGTLLWRGSEKTIDFTNQALTSILLFLFGGLLLIGSQTADFSSLLNQQNWSEEWSALPVVFLALVYHDLVPLICKYLGWNKAKIRTALLVGSFIPFVLFVAWDAVALALVPGTVNVIEAGGVLDPITVLIETQGEIAGTAIGVFSLLAIGTSFIGTSLSLVEHFKKEVQNWSVEQSRTQEVDERLLAVCCALGPPSLAAFSNPGMFFTATKIAGGYGMTLLYGILPPIMAWGIRHPIGAKPCPQKQAFVPGGRPVLASLTSFAASIEIGKLVSDLEGIFSTSGVSGVLSVATRPVTNAMNIPISDLASLEPPTGLLSHLHG